MLLKTIEEIQAIMPIGAGNEFDRLQPHIQNAETKYIASLLGESLYEELLEFYDILPIETPTPTQEATIELLSRVQHALIHLAYFVGFDFLNITISDAGFQRSESEYSKSLYKYQEDNLREYFSDAGFNTLDSILIFIENNIEHFNEFKVSSNWTVLKSSFLPTVQTIQNIPFNIFESRLTFLNLKPHIAHIEDTSIHLALGDTIYKEIKAGMILDEPPEKITAILPYIRKPLIYLASAMLMEETGATLGKHGLFFEKLNAAYPDNRFVQPSTDSRIAALVARNRSIGNAYLDGLKSYLLANSEDWESFDGTSGSLYNRDNTDKKSFWA